MFYAKAILCSIVWTWLKSALDSNLFDFIVREKENLITNPFVTQKLYVRKNIQCRKRYGLAMLLIFMGKKENFLSRQNPIFPFLQFFNFLLLFFSDEFPKMRKCIAKLGCHGYRPTYIFWSPSNLKNNFNSTSFRSNFIAKVSDACEKLKLDSKWSLK